MKEIEYSIIKGLIVNERFFTSCFPYIKSNYFDVLECKRVFELIKGFYDKYDTRAGMESLRVMIYDGKSRNQSEYEAMVYLYQRLEKDNSNIEYEWLYAETEKYCKQQALTQAVFHVASIIDESNNNSNEVAGVGDILQDALSITFDDSVGVDYFRDANARYDEYINKDSKIPFNFPELDLMTAGGLSRKSLFCYLAPTNNGKTRRMCFDAASFLKQGYNVLYFTLEMDEIKIQQRVDANLIDTPINEIDKLSREEFLSRVNAIQNKTKGSFIVKQLPTGAGHVGHMRHVIKELWRKRGIKPDVIIVDYIDICASLKHPKAEGNDKGKYVSEELRSLAIETNCGMITGTQTNRSGSKTAEIDETAISDSFAKVMTFDTLVSMFADEIMAERGEQSFKLLKSRDVDKSKFSSVIIGVDSEKMRYISRVDHKTILVNEVKNKQRGTLDKISLTGHTKEVAWD